METQRIILRILRVFFQGYRLITAGLKKEIDGLEEEPRKSEMKALVETQGIDRDKPFPVMKCHLWIGGERGPRISKEPEVFSAPFNGNRKNMDKQIKTLAAQIAKQRGHQIKAEDIGIVY